ncbi:MAG: hypothetical protein WC554_17645 [Clostridia bacterium]
MREIIKEIIAICGIFTLFFLGGYVIEFGRLKARRKLKVCDLCFKKLEAMKKVDDDTTSELLK